MSSDKTATALTRLLAWWQLVPIAVALVVAFGNVQDHVARALDTNPEPAGEAGAVTIVTGAALAGLIGLVALILLLTAGPKTAKVTAGFLFLWSAIVTALNPVAGPLTLTAPLADTNNTLSAMELQRQITQALPGWVTVVHLTFTAVTAILVVGLFLPRNRRS